MNTITLRGITWNHSRGYVPVVASAQRFSETHPGVSVVWEKRSLQAFADEPIERLAEQYDLLVIDHPWAGFAARHSVLVPFDDYLPAEFMADQGANSVGASHRSYEFGGMHFALAIDAAAPVASYRLDLLDGAALPQSWLDLVALAKRGKVIFPAIPVDSIMAFFMMASSMGHDAVVDDEWAVPDDVALRALDGLRELASLCPPEIFGFNPIACYEALSRRDDFAYCPFAFGYSNYSRDGYSDHLLMFTDPVVIDPSVGTRARTTLGGTGLAISARSPQRALALDYCRFTADPLVQRTLYVENGGQPGYRGAWTDAEVNRRTHNYFINTLPTLDRAYLRPRFAGFMHFQDRAGDVVRDHMMQGGSAADALNKLKALFGEAKRVEG